MLIRGKASYQKIIKIKAMQTVGRRANDAFVYEVNTSMKRIFQGDFLGEKLQAFWGLV